MYISHNIGLSKHHRDALVRAASNKSPVTLRLKNSNLQGSDALHLTKTQINRLTKANSAGKGCDLKLSYKQLSHGLKSGSGFLSSLLGMGVGKQTGDGLLSSLLGMGVGKKKKGGFLGSYLIGKKLLGAGVKKEKRGQGFLGDVLGTTKDIGKKLVNVGVDKGIGVAGKLFENMLLDKLTGDKKKKSGDGFGDFLSSVTNKVLPIAGNVGMKVGEQLLMKKLMGKGVKRGRKSKKQGDGFFDFVDSVKDKVLPIAGNVGLKVAEAALLKKLTGGKGIKDDVKRVVGGLPDILLSQTGKDVLKKLSSIGGHGIVNPGY